MSAWDRYRQAMSELMLHGGRVAELAETIDDANDEIIDSLLDALRSAESRFNDTDERIRHLEEAVDEAVTKLKRR